MVCSMAVRLHIRKRRVFDGGGTMKVGDLVHVNITSPYRDNIGLLVNIRHASLFDDVRYEVICKGKLISLPHHDVIKYKGEQ